MNINNLVTGERPIGDKDMSSHDNVMKQLLKIGALVLGHSL